MTDRSVLKISSVEVNGDTSTNVINMRYDLILKDKVRFTPNTTSGLALRSFPKYHRIVLVFDSINTLFDTYSDEDGVNIPLPTFSVTMRVKNNASGTEQDETWTFEASKTYVTSKGESRIDRYEERRPWEVELICIGTRTRTFV